METLGVRRFQPLRRCRDLRSVDSKVSPPGVSTEQASNTARGTPKASAELVPPNPDRPAFARELGPWVLRSPGVPRPLGLVRERTAKGKTGVPGAFTNPGGGALTVKRDAGCLTIELVERVRSSPDETKQHPGLRERVAADFRCAQSGYVAGLSADFSRVIFTPRFYNYLILQVNMVFGAGISSLSAARRITRAKQGHIRGTAHFLGTTCGWLGE